MHWQEMAQEREPFSTISQLSSFLKDVGDMVASENWGNTGAYCSNESPSPEIFLQQARGLLIGDLQFNDVTPIFITTGTLEMETVVGPYIAYGMNMAINVLCILGVLQWFQWISNAVIIIVFVIYLKRNWVDKAFV